MHVFEITVQRKDGDTWPVVAEYSPPQGQLPVRSTGRLFVDVEQLLREPTPLDYGTFLGRALFRDDVRDSFVRALSQSQDVLENAQQYASPSAVPATASLFPESDAIVEQTGQQDYYPQQAEHDLVLCKLDFLVLCHSCEGRNPPPFDRTGCLPTQA